MAIPEIIEDLLVKYTKRNVPHLEEPHFDQKKDEAYVVAVLRDETERASNPQSGQGLRRVQVQSLSSGAIAASPRPASSAATVSARIDFKIWCIKRQDVVNELRVGSPEVIEILATQKIDETFNSIMKDFK